MKILMINTVSGIRSTGRICVDLAAALEKEGHTVKVAYGRENVPEKYQRYSFRIGTDSEVLSHVIKARITDKSGFGSTGATKKFIKWVMAYDPDIIHLHNIHGYYINVEILFDYLRICGKKIVWTLHDCWAFTGHAAFCEGVSCERWIDGCYDCPYKNEYPASFIDQSKKNWNKKKDLFNKIPNLNIIVPSEWLAKLVEKSFFSSYPVKVIYNEIDTNVFKYRKSDVKDRLGLEEKKVILGVAAIWTKRKGIDDFKRLLSILPEEYQIVLVGLTKNQIQSLPVGICGVEKTDYVDELAELYSAADVFVNPTYEDNYPTTNLEAIACGTPVITYDTGGSPESARYYGAVVNKGDVNAVATTIMNMKFIDNTYPNIFGNGQWLKQYYEVYFN